MTIDELASHASGALKASLAALNLACDPSPEARRYLASALLDSQLAAAHLSRILNGPTSDAPPTIIPGGPGPTPAPAGGRRPLDAPHGPDCTCGGLRGGS